VIYVADSGSTSSGAIDGSEIRTEQAKKHFALVHLGCSYSQRKMFLTKHKSVRSQTEVVTTFILDQNATYLQPSTPVSDNYSLV